jgi:ankyrin repeat protein
MSFSPLHYAAVHINPSTALKLTDMLLKKGASVNAINMNGATPLFNACSSRRHIDVVKLLLDIGSDVKKKDVRGETPLHTAAFYSDNGAMIDLLISKGADVNSGSPENTPLHRAAYSGLRRIYPCLFFMERKLTSEGT